MVNLPNNTLLSAYNDSPTRRTPLALATSQNGGKTWTRVAVVEDAINGSFHYPNVFYVPRDVRALAMHRSASWPENGVAFSMLVQADGGCGRLKRSVLVCAVVVATLSLSSA